MPFGQCRDREVGDVVAVAAGDQFLDVWSMSMSVTGVLRSGTTSVRWWGIVGRAASGVGNRGTMVIGCWQCGQFRVAVGSNGSRTGAGGRECARTDGGCGSSIRAGGAGSGAWPRRRARASSRAWSRRCSDSRRQTSEQQTVRTIFPAWNGLSQTGQVLVSRWASLRRDAVRHSAEQ